MLNIRLNRRKMLMLCLSAPLVAKANDNTLSVSFAYQSVVDDQLLLIDIRTKHEWRRTGIPLGAYGLDMESKTFSDDLLALSVKYPHRKIAFISTAGGRSAFLVRYLARRGVTVYDVPGGVIGKSNSWKSKGLPFADYRKKQS